MNTPKSVMNAYDLAKIVSDSEQVGPKGPVLFLLGLRVGLSLALYRPNLSSEFIGLYHQHILDSTPATIEEMSQFELNCMERILARHINSVGPLEQN
jgi:hypothetical protein